MVRRGWCQPDSTEPVISPVNIRRDRVAIVEVDVERHGHLRPILHPVGFANRYVDALSGQEFENGSAVLVFRLVNRGVVIHSPDPFDIRLRQYLAVTPVEYANSPAALNLIKPTTFTVDVVGGYPVRRSYKDQCITLLHHVVEVFPGHSDDFVNAGIE